MVENKTGKKLDLKSRDWVNLKSWEKSSEIRLKKFT